MGQPTGIEKRLDEHTQGASKKQQKTVELSVKGVLKECIA